MHLYRFSPRHGDCTDILRELFMKKMIILIICIIGTSYPSFSNSTSLKRSRLSNSTSLKHSRFPKNASSKKIKKNRNVNQYDFSSIHQSPFTFKDMGMSDAEFFITDKNTDIISSEINRVQDSIAELDYTNQVSYEPKYLNQKPKTQNQKRAYLKGYLQILEEAKM